MKKNLLTALKVLLFLSLGIFLVWFALKDVDADQKEQIKSAFSNANYSWVIISLLIGMLSHVSRAMRWKLMLQTLGRNPKLSNTFFAVMVGYMANYAPIPRLGELTRCGILSRYEKIPFTESFGTVIAERLIDVFCLMLVFGITFYVQFEKINGLAHEYIIDKIFGKFTSIISHPLLTSLLLAGLIIAFFLFIKYRNKKGNSFISRIIGLLTGFFAGLKTVRNIKRPWIFLMHTVFIWLIYYISLHLCFFALPETSGLGLKEGLAIFSLGTLGVVFTPGGIGAYQYLVKKVLISFAITLPIAVAFPWIVWTSQFILIIIAGLISLILLPILNKEDNGQTIDTTS